MIQPRQLLNWRSLLLLLVFIVQHGILNAQTKTVQGTVKNEKGDPLAGASISLHDTKQVVLTDESGTFIIKVNNSKIKLAVSMVGYEAAVISTTAGEQVNVVLKESKQDMEEVVVVGYGKQKRTSLTGAVSQIGGEQLKQAPAMNVSNLLAGRLPGLVALQQSGRPGNDDAALRVRGLGTMGDNAPTVIVDGVQRNFYNLDPNEIESISILKDAASAAAYGFQGANGVILVTTKRGKTRKATIAYTGQLSQNTNTRMPKFLNGPDYMEWYRKAEQLDNQYRIETGADPSPYTYSQEEIDAVRNGTNKSPFLGNTDWLGELTSHKSLSQHHNVSISGGSDKVKYFSTLGYLDQEGVIKKTNFTRYNLRTNLDVEFNKVLSAALDLGARLENTGTPGIPPDNVGYGNAFVQAASMLPNMPKYTPDGLPTATGAINPLASIDKSGYQRIQNGVFQGSLIFKANIPQVKGLELRLLTAYDKEYREEKAWLTPYYIGQRLRGGSGWAYTPVLPTGIGKTSLQQVFSTQYRTTFQPSINYNNTFGDHSITGLLLYEYSERKGNNFYARALNFALRDIQELSKGSAAPEDLSLPGGSSSVEQRAGYVGRVNYGYKEKYFAEVVARYDGSINFPKNKRYGLFPAVSLGWVISKESFFDELTETVNYLKLRGSIGQLGNDRIVQFGYLQTFTYPTDPVAVIGGQPVKALLPGAPPNPNITWETATVSNLGLESSLWNGLLGMNVDVFYKQTKNILMGQDNLFPPSLGGYFPSVFNSGIVENKGIDLQITHRNNINKLRYSVTGNFTWARNKILRRDVTLNSPAWQVGVGRSIGEKYGFVAEGLFQNWDEVNGWPTSPSGSAAPGFIKYRDINGDGKITDAGDMTFIGRSNMPEIMYGLNLQLNYGVFDFSALFQGAGLADVSLGGTYEGDQGVPYGLMDNTAFSRTFYNDGNSPYYLVQQAWTPDNPNAKYPRLTTGNTTMPNNNGWSNSFFVRDGSYLRLKAVQLGVSIKPEILKRLKFEQARIFVAGYNLFTWDHLKYVDPEMPNVNNGFYPQQRMITIGTNITL